METTQKITIKAELRAISEEGKQPRIYGAIPYNSAGDLGAFKEILRPGCFTSALQRGNRIMCFFNHDTGKPLGNSESGTLLIKDTASALEVEIMPDGAVSWAADAIRAIQRGDVPGLSFGFTMPRDGSGEKRKDGIREIVKIEELLEISPCTLPAYEASRVTARDKQTKGNRNMNEETRKKRNELFDLYGDIASTMSKIKKEKRALTESEGQNISELMTSFDALAPSVGADIPLFRDGGFKGIDAYYSRRDDFRLPAGLLPSPGGAHQSGGEFNFRANPEGADIRSSFNRYLLHGREILSVEEFRALQADAAISGGYLVAPEAFAQQIVSGLDNEVFVRQLATTFPVPNADSLGIPSLDNDFGDPEWTSELSTGNADSTMSLGKRSLTPYPLARRILVSNKLLRAAYLNPEDLVRQRMIYKFAVVQENNFLNGSGAGRPLGVFTASDDGIPTSRDVSTGNTATSITTDGLIEALFSLNAAYMKRAVWIFHRDAIKQIRKLKDGNGNYIWQPGIAGNLPATILERPYYISEYAPNSFVSGHYVGIVGDFSFYWIADALSMQVQRLNELYAETNQVGFIGRCEADGMPVLSSAFARVKLA